jgi:hypothetical protein
MVSKKIYSTLILLKLKILLIVPLQPPNICYITNPLAVSAAEAASGA